ncbi:MAG: hypothetical protein ABI625_16905 [bacterium]
MARGANSAVADLRAAAMEAGISPAAFDAALAELNSNTGAPVPSVREQPRRRPRLFPFVFAALALLAVGWVTLRLVVPVREGAAPSTPMLTEPIMLNCLSPDEAAGLIRPLLPLPSNKVVGFSGQAGRVLTVHATPAQLRMVKAALEKYEGTASSPACARPPAPAATP